MLFFIKHNSTYNQTIGSCVVSVGMRSLRCVILLFLLLCPIVANADLLYYDNNMVLDATSSAPGAIVSCTWSSSSSKISFLIKDNHGTAVIHANSYFSGMATILATYMYEYFSESEKKIKQGSGHYSWTVSCGQVSVNLVASEFTSPLKIGEKRNLSITMNNKEHSVPIRWESSNTKVATVDNQGIVTAKSAGTTTITLHNDWDGTSSNGTITVKSNDPLSVSILADNKVVDGSVLSMAVGASKQLSSKMSPSDAISLVSWQSNNSDIVSVSSSGLLRAVSQGKAMITCKTSNGKQAFLYVSVYLPGDVDGDGEVCVADLSAIVWYINGKGEGSNFDAQTADINRDGVVDNKDLKYIEEQILIK